MSVFGIDFGTTNSAAVKLDDHALPEKYGDDAGAPSPSIVAIDRATGEAVGGRLVWENREKYIDSGNYHVVQSVKWLLGTDRVWNTEERQWTPEDVTSFIFTQLSNRAEKLGLEPIRKATVTIPVDFPARARTSLRKAAEKAGIQINTFVTESTAAFMRYLPRLRHCHHVAVFDWGGGTLDISILEVRNDTIVELATEGMDIAGDAIDLDLARAVHTRIMQERNSPIPFESMAATDRDTLRTKCERAKRQLSQVDSTDILLPSYSGAPAHFIVERGWFESLIAAHVDLAIEVLTKAVEKSHLSFDSIDRILVIGGSSKLRLLHDRMRNDARFSAAIQVSDDAEWDVAHGAAIVEQAPGGYATAESIGLILSDNSYYEIIPRGERLSGVPKELSLSLVEDARQANIVVAKRDHRGPSAERILTFGVDTLGFDLEEIKVAYNVTQDLILRVSAESSRMNSESGTSREYGKLQFAYHL